MLKNSFTIRNQVYKEFGKKAFKHGLFYLYEKSLRFELSTDGSFVEQFHQALSKGIEILNALFNEQDEVYACISFYGKKGLLANLSVFKQLKELDIEIDKHSCEIWQEKCPKDEDFPETDYFRTFIIIPVSRTEVFKLLWSAIASDFNIHPKVNAKLYFFNLKLAVLAHPYDDRGMDIIGENFELKRRLFNKFNHYLLDYDRDTMNSSFNNI